MTAGHRWMVVVNAVVVVVLLAAAAGCGSRPAADGGGTAPGGGKGASPSAGAAALGTRPASIQELAKRMQAATGGCKDARQKTPVNVERISDALGPSPFSDEAAPVWLPHVEALATCTVGANEQGALDMVLFKDGAFDDFQAAWREFIRPQKYGALRAVFGNGFAVHATSDTQPVVEARLGLKYLRCKAIEELNAQKIPADVDGCFFSDVDGQ